MYPGKVAGNVSRMETEYPMAIAEIDAERGSGSQVGVLLPIFHVLMLPIIHVLMLPIIHVLMLRIIRHTGQLGPWDPGTLGPWDPWLLK